MTNKEKEEFDNLLDKIERRCNMLVGSATKQLKESAKAMEQASRLLSGIKYGGN
ncbi:hypothetical protein EZS27_009360 [termite gut metagenome]|uniref:Uncharacterized protein n=1 Tax=termite gut metagenome TaxID=433724 RepID=A0A5J4SC34_9ZZZZ